MLDFAEWEKWKRAMPRTYERICKERTRLEREQYIKDFVAKMRERRTANKMQTTPEDFVHLISRAANVPVADIRGSQRTKPLVMARHACAYLLRCNFNLSFPAVATFVCLSDHSTIVHIMKKYRDNDEFRNYVQQIARTAEELSHRHVSTGDVE